MMRARANRVSAVISTTAILWIALFWIAAIAVPVFTLLSAFRGPLPISDPSIVRIACVTFGQAALSALIASVVALPLGAWIGSRAGAGRLWAECFLALPFGVPTVVAGLAWVIVLGRSGLLASAGLNTDLAYTMKAVVLAHVVFNVPWIALWVAQARLFVPESRLEAARTLGAGPFRAFRTVVWPQIRWAFLSAVCQAWVFCALSFALVLGLGGGPPVQTLETELYSRMRYGGVDIPGSIACALWEFGVALLPWLLVVVFQSIHDRENEKQGRAAPAYAAGSRRLRFPWQAIVAALFFVPYLAIFVDTGRGFGFFGSVLGGQILSACGVSAYLALFTALGSVFTAVCAVVAVDFVSERRRVLRAVLLFFLGLPSGISALVLGLGLWLSYRNWIDPFSGSALAIVCVQIAIFFPIAFRVFWPLARKRPRDLLDAAATLGASSAQAFWAVEWPRWKLPLMSAFGMVAAASLGEVAAVSLFYSENLVPLPLLVSRWMAQYRFAEAQAVAGLLLVLCAGTIGGVFLARRGELRG